MSKDSKSPQDLGLKVGSPAQVIWEEVEKQCLSTIESCKKEILINEGILETARSKIEAEKRKV